MFAPRHILSNSFTDSSFVMKITINWLGMLLLSLIISYTFFLERWENQVTALPLRQGAGEPGAGEKGKFSSNFILSLYITYSKTINISKSFIMLY